jgi:hypothetical protein
MPAILRVLYALFFVIAFSTSVSAAPPQKEILLPTRDMLVQHWEEAVRASEYTQIFEPTEEAGVYDFETTFFPYKGKLRLLNAVIVLDGDSYYDDVYEGIIELELPDADDDFRKKYASSYYAWQEQNRYYFDAQNGVWFPAGTWSKYLSDREEKMVGATRSTCSIWKNTALWRSVLPLAFFLVVILGLLAFARKQNKRVWDNHAKALEEQQRGLRMVEESLKHQQEHTRLLQQILENLKK